MKNLPPILRRDLYRQRILPWVHGFALAASFALIGLVLLGFVGARGSEYLSAKDGNGVIQTFKADRLPDLTMKVYAHLDDEEIARIREACR